jgi:hypothetical protein
MRIAETYSHLNGLEYLLVRKPTLWQEIQSVIAEVDANECRTKTSEEKTLKEKFLYSSIDLAAAFMRELWEKSWNERKESYRVNQDEKPICKRLTMPAEEQNQETKAAIETRTFIYNQLDYIKERVAVEAQFGEYTPVIYAKPLALYVGDRIDVGIEILPMKSLQNQMSSGVGYYEGEFYNVVRQGRGVPAVPLVLIGIDP